MAASKTKKSTSKVVVPVKSVQVILLGCSNCGEELEEVRLCPDCKAPMRVIQITEKFGDDAELYLQQVLRGESSDESGNDALKNIGVENTVVDADTVDLELNPEEVKENTDEVEGLDEIFPDDGEGAPIPKKEHTNADWVSELDNEETTEDLVDLVGFNSDDGEIPEL